MIYPSIDKLLNKVNSKYTLVIAAAKRARTIKNEGNLTIRNPHSTKYVGMALEEIEQGELIIEGE
jgi:DNA-directed RNA polymerase subunit omega